MRGNRRTDARGNCTNVVKDNRATRNESVHQQDEVIVKVMVRSLSLIIRIRNSMKKWRVPPI